MKISNFEELLEKAESGDAESQYQVGQILLNGNSVDKDEEKAASSARKGHVNAMNRMVKCYSIGAGVAEIDARAEIWYQEAAAAETAMKKTARRSLPQRKPQ